MSGIRADVNEKVITTAEAGRWRRRFNLHLRLRCVAVGRRTDANRAGNGLSFR